MDTPSVLIVGAGPTGLMLALQLARRGVALRIIDAAPGPGLHSRAIGVHARTLEFYRQLGFAGEMVAAGEKADLIRLQLRHGGSATVNLGKMGEGLSPYPFMLSYPQDQHEPFLIARLAALGVAVEWNRAFRGFHQDAVGVACELSDDEVLRVAYLCGCDGAGGARRAVSAAARWLCRTGRRSAGLWPGAGLCGASWVEVWGGIEWSGRGAALARGAAKNRSAQRLPP